MRSLRYIITLVLIFVFISIKATNYVWDGGAGDNNWSSPNNWDLNSGTPSTSTDNAFFDATTPGGTVVVDVVLSIQKITFNGLTNAIAFEVNNSVTLSGNLILDTDVTLNGSSGFIMVGSSNANLKCSGLTLNSLEVAKTGASLTLTSLLRTSGNLTITSGTLDMNAYDAEIGGDWTYNGGTFTHSNQQIAMKGAIGQNIGGGISTTFYDLEIDNTNGVTLARSTTVNNILRLTNGDLISSSSDKLILGSVATTTGGKASSHINGPVSKTWNDSGSDFYIFPVGNGTYYKPCGVSPDDGTTETWTVEYVHNTPPNVGELCTGEFYIIYVAEYYWNIDRTGAVDADIRLYWDDDSGVDESKLDDLVIGHHSSGCLGGPGWEIASNPTWDNVDGGSNYIETAVPGSPLSDFSPFTLASSDLSSHALPIQLISFDVAATTDYTALLTWTTQTEINNDFFTIERSRNGIDFTEMAKVYGAGKSNAKLNYQWIDEAPLPGVSYYRLKQTDNNGDNTRTDMRALALNAANGSFEVFPNPASNGEVNLHFKDDEHDLVVLTNLLGVEVQKTDLKAHQNITWEISAEVVPGSYILSVYAKKKLIGTKRLQVR